MAQYGSYYDMVGGTQFRAILMATAIALALALIIGAVKFIAGRIRDRKN